MAHYIIDYKGQLLTDLLSEVETLENVTKFQILQDRKLLAKAGVISYADVVNILPAFTNEESYLVNTGLSQLISELELFVDEDSETEKAFQSLVGKLFAKNYARLGWDKVAGESAGDESLRGIVLSKTLYAENADAKAKASQIFAAHKENLAGIPADIRPIVLNNEIKTTNSAELVKTYRETYVKTSLQEFKRELEGAVALIKDEKVIAELLESFKMLILLSHKILLSLGSTFCAMISHKMLLGLGKKQIGHSLKKNWVEI